MQLAHERCHHHQLDEATEAPDPAMARSSVLVVPDEDVRPLGTEPASGGRPWMGPGDVDDDVMALAALGEILARVVNDAVRADRQEHVELPGSIYRGHLCPYANASCTAKVPTAPPAPLITTDCP